MNMTSLNRRYAHAAQIVAEVQVFTKVDLYSLGPTKLNSMQSTRPRVLQDLDRAITLHRIPKKLWALLLIPYAPLGLLLAFWRICMSLQALLLLLIFPDGTLKMWMLRIYFGVLGIVVTTAGQNTQPKIYIANRLSYIDHIVLHLATQCTTVSFGRSSRLPPLAPMFSHHVFHGDSDESIEDEARSLSDFDEQNSTDYTPYAVQPECIPTNGSHMLLKFNTWPFAVVPTVQPVALTTFRPLPFWLTTGKSSGWWDFWWTIFVPFTHFHVRFLPPMDILAEESPQQFSQRVNSTLASKLGLKESEITQKDIDNWFADLEPPPPPKPVIPQGPIIPRSEFDPSKLSSKGSPEIEVMVQQVTAVLPQVPHTVIRNDLLVTKSVDMTITNLLEGRIKYTPIPNLYETTTASLRNRSAKSGTSNSQTKPKRSGGGGLFGSKGSTSSLSSAKQRQLSLEEKKKLLIENARKRYIEKHGLTQTT